MWINSDVPIQSMVTASRDNLKKITDGFNHIWVESTPIKCCSSYCSLTPNVLTAWDRKHTYTSSLRCNTRGNFKYNTTYIAIWIYYKKFCRVYGPQEEVGVNIPGAPPPRTFKDRINLVLDQGIEGRT